MVKEIITGHLNELLNKEQALHEKRFAICKACPLFKETHVGPICNPDLYLNPTTGEVEDYPKAGFYKGCRCRLNAKTRNPDSHCPAKKW